MGRKQPLSLVNERHKAFINELSKTNLNQTAAYLRTFPNSSHDAAKTSASRLMKKIEIQTEVTASLKKSGIPNLEDLISRLDKIIDNPDTKDMAVIQAITVKAKLSGIWTEKQVISKRETVSQISGEELEAIQTKADRIIFSKEINDLTKQVEEKDKQIASLRKLIEPIESL